MLKKTYPPPICGHCVASVREVALAGSCALLRPWHANRATTRWTAASWRRRETAGAEATAIPSAGAKGKGQAELARVIRLVQAKRWCCCA